MNLENNVSCIIYSNSEYRPNVDLEAWIMPDSHLIPPELNEAGEISQPGWHSFFIPKQLLREKQTKRKKFYPYTIFQADIVEDQNYNEIFGQFVFKKEIQEYLMSFVNPDDPEPVFIPKHCQNSLCAGLLTSTKEDMSYVIEHINELKLKLNVYWLGSNLKKAIKGLLEKYTGTEKYVTTGSKFLVLHWSPSEITSGRIEFVPMLMPKCAELVSSSSTGCKYDPTTVLKVFNREAFDKDNVVKHSLETVAFESDHIKSIFKVYEKYEDEMENEEKRERSMLLGESYAENGQNLTVNFLNENSNKYSFYNKIACEWLKQNTAAYMKWHEKMSNKKRIIGIGGIFPHKGTGKHF